MVTSSGKEKEIAPLGNKFEVLPDDALGSGLEQVDALREGELDFEMLYRQPDKSVKTRLGLYFDFLFISPSY